MRPSRMLEKKIYIYYFPGGKSVWEKTVPEVLPVRPEVEGRGQYSRPRAQFFFPYRPTYLFIYFFFFGRLLFKVGKETGIKGIAYVASRVLKKHQKKNTKENNVRMFQRLALF